MTPRQLRGNIKRLPANTPKHKALEQALCEGVGFGNAWYNSQKEHWLGWLDEYDGPGAYGRQTDKPRTAQYAYNHIQCAPMLFWLADALVFAEETLDDAFDAVLAAPKRNASQCAALRTVISWPEVHRHLIKAPKPNVLSDIFGAPTLKRL